MKQVALSIILWSCFFLELPGSLAADDQATAHEVAAFRADVLGKARSADKKFDSVVVGKDGWMFFVPELHHVAAGDFWGEAAKRVSKAADLASADPLPAIVDFKNQLKNIGVELLLVPVPPKAVIYPDEISSAVKVEDGETPPRLDKSHQQFYQLLRDNDVRVLDLTDTFLNNRSSKTGPLYCKSDTHWAGPACVIAAEEIGKEIRKTFTPKSTLGGKLVAGWKRVLIDGDLRQSLPEAKRPEKENLALHFVGTKSPIRDNPIPVSKESPILLLGDSHSLVFNVGDDMHVQGAGLADQLAMELKIPIDLLGVRGSGATPARINLLRRARADAKYLQGKKVVVWCFSAREFTESQGWDLVPVVK